MSIKRPKGYALIIALVIVFILGLLSATLLNFITQQNRLTIQVKLSTLLLQDFESAIGYGTAWVSANYPAISQTATTLPNGNTVKIRGQILPTTYMQGAAIVKLTFLFPSTANTISEADHALESFVYVMTKVAVNVGGNDVSTTPSPYPAYLIRWRIVK